MDGKMLLRRIFVPPVWLMWILLAVSAIALLFVFACGRSETPAACGVYAVSFYALCTFCVYCVKRVPKRYRSVREKIRVHPTAGRYVTDAAYRAHISLYVSLAVNLLYVGVNVFSCVLYRSAWFAILAVYHMILAVMRFLLVQYIRVHEIGRNRLGELKRARLCSAILLLLNLVLTGAVMMILYQNKGFSYRGVLIYAVAGYTFYITAHAVADLVKYRKYQSPVLTVSKVIALSAALVSVLSLETAMLSRFGGEMDPESRRWMVVLTGVGVSAIVIGLSVFVIAGAAKEIKEINRHGRDE